MGDEFIPDYKQYSVESLIDVYQRIDRIRNPIRTKKIEEELRNKLKLDSAANVDEEIKFVIYKNYKSSEKIELPSYEKKIRRGALFSFIAGTLVLLLVFIAQSLPEGYPIRDEYNIYSLIDVIILYSLSFGIYKKNKYAAIGLAVYFILSKLFLYLDTGNMKTLTGGLVYLYFIIEAIRGIYEFERLKMI